MELLVLGGQRAVVVGVRNEVDRGVGDGLVHPGAGADRGLGQVLVGEARREDAHGGEALLEQGEVRVVGLDGDGGVVGGLNGGDRREERGVGGVLVDARKGGRDVLGGHRVAVGELGALTDGDGVGGLVDLLRVAGGELGEGGVVVVVDAVEALEDVPVGTEAEGGRRGDRAVVGRSVRGARGDGAATAGRSGVVAGGSVVATAATGGQAEQARNRGTTQERATRHGAVKELLHGSSFSPPEAASELATIPYGTNLAGLIEPLHADTAGRHDSVPRVVVASLIFFWFYGCNKLL